MLETADFRTCFQSIYPTVDEKNIKQLDECTFQFPFITDVLFYVTYDQALANQFTALFYQPCHILRGYNSRSEVFYDVITRVNETKEVLFSFQFDSEELELNISVQNGLKDSFSYFNLVLHADAEPLIEEMQEFILEEFLKQDPKCRLHFLTQTVSIFIRNWHTVQSDILTK